MRIRSRFCRGVTMIELLVGVAILAILLAVGVPSLREWLMSQRVSAIASELLSDLQFARSEAVSRNEEIFVAFKAAPGRTCYSVHSSVDWANPVCNCLNGAGSACSGTGNKELKTVTIESGLGVTVTANQVQEFTRAAEFQKTNSPLTVLVSDGGTKRLNVLASAYVQRPSVCVPSGSTVPGFKPC